MIDKEILVFENNNVKLLWEYINKENLKEWEKHYETNKQTHLLKIFFQQYGNNPQKIIWKLIEWDIRIIKMLKDTFNSKFTKFLISNYIKNLRSINNNFNIVNVCENNTIFLDNNNLFNKEIEKIYTIKTYNETYKNDYNYETYFYFLKIYEKKAKKYIYLGFILFIDNFYPYKCNFIKCNDLIITQQNKFPFVWYIYSHYNYKQLMLKFFKKEIKFIDLCDNLIYYLTKSKIYWLKSDTEELLKRLYTSNRNFFPLMCNNDYLTFLRKNSHFYRCKIINL